MLCKEDVNVLLVEDELIMRMAIRRAFKKANIPNPIHEAVDGIEALKALRGEGRDVVSPPYIIMLDLNLPRMNGIEFLKELRQDENLRKSVVFVLTTSHDEKDILAAYNLNVAGYIVKSNVGQDFIRLTNLLDAYWTVDELPERSGSR